MSAIFIFRSAYKLYVIPESIKTNKGVKKPTVLFNEP